MSSLQDNPDKNPTPDTSEPVAKLSDSPEDIRHNSVTEPVHEEGGLTFVDIGDAGMDPEELEHEFANDDPDAHVQQVEVESVPEEGRREGFTEGVDTGVN